MSVHLRFGSLYMLAGGHPATPSNMARHLGIVQQLVDAPGVWIHDNPAAPYSAFITTQSPEQDQLVLHTLTEQRQPFFYDPDKDREQVRPWDIRSVLGQSFKNFYTLTEYLLAPMK